MKPYIDIEDNVILKDIWEAGWSKGWVEGYAEGKAKAMAENLIYDLRAKFSRVPRWARARIAKASAQRLDAWIRKIPTADNIEGVIGKR